MADTPQWTPEQIKELRSRYLSGSLSPEGKQAFESRFPDLVPQGPPPTQAPEESSWLGSVGREAARFGIPAATSLAGAVVGGMTSPVTGPIGAIAGEMAGSYGGRRLNVALGLEKQGEPVIGPLDTGDVASLAIPGGMGAGRLAYRGLKQLIAPSMSQQGIQALQQPISSTTAEELIASGGKTGGQSAYQSGALIQKALEQHKDEVLAQAKQVYDPVRQAIPTLDIAGVEAFAKKRQVSLGDALVGSEVSRGVTPAAPESELAQTFSSVSFDDAMTIRSRLQGYARALVRTDPKKARAYGQVERELDQAMGDAADSAGQQAAWRDANAWYKREYVDRFASKITGQLMDTARTSGEQLIDRVATGRGLPVERAKEFMAGLNNIAVEGQVPLEAARQEVKAGMIQKLLNDSIPDKNLGVLNADALRRRLEQIPPESRELLLGKELSDAMTEFSSKLANSRRNLGIAIAGAGAAGMAGSLIGKFPQGIGPSTALSALGIIEASNEVGYLTRLIVNKPSVARALANAVTTGSSERLSKITGMQSLGILSSQTVPRSGPDLGIGLEEQPVEETR